MSQSWPVNLLAEGFLPTGDPLLSWLRTTSGGRQMSRRSPSEARSLFPEVRGLRRGGGERPFSNSGSARTEASSQEGAEMKVAVFRRRKLAAAKNERN